MSRTHYQIYQEQTFVLAKTLIVKHEEVANSMNEELYYRGYVVDDNPYNWRYYLNLSGEYHEADRDELYDLYGTEYMMVKLPSDSGPIEVPLTRDLLHGNNADKSMMNEYQIGSKYYNELVSRYPDFETLIIGILNPIERSVSLAARNGEILFIAGRYKKIEGDRSWFDTTWYSINETLIEPQEDNLIFELQVYIDSFLKHWNNPDYAKGNDLYVVTMLGILYANIPPTILNIRLGNCKTVRAHSFHIRQYLESNGQIGRYVDFMPIGSALWLYRNVTYLEANAGKQLTFNSIVDNMLTPNDIPMSAYSIRHELTNLSDDKLLPTGMLYKEVVNFEVVGASDDDRTVRDILEDQASLARDNHLDIDERASKIQDTIDWGGDDRINTKVLESEMMELGEPYPFTLDNFLFNLWGYTALRGYYTGTAYATNPLTGDRISFSVKNAYILAQYCMNKAVAGIDLVSIPVPTLYSIPKTSQPEDLPEDPRFSIRPNIDKMMSWCVQDKTRRLKVLEVAGTFIPNFYATDSEEFFDNVDSMYHERIRKYNTYCDVENVEERGDLELVAKRLYWNGFKQSTVDMNYDEWFRTVGFDPTQFNNTDLLSIGLELIASATGVVKEDNLRSRWLQRAILSIVRHFISYTVHVIEKYTDGEVSYLEGQTLRYSNFTWTYIGEIDIRHNVALDYTLATQVKHSVHLDISNIFEDANVDTRAQYQASLDMGGFEYGQTRHQISLGTYSLGAEVANVEFNVEKKPAVYIIVIDDVVNTIAVNSINARSNYASYAFHLPPGDSAILSPNINLRAKDNYVNGYAIDINKHAVEVRDVYGDTTDAELDAQKRVDTTSASPYSISGNLSDESLNILGFIDSSGVVPVSPSGNIYESYDNFGVNNPDTTHLDISNISARVTDSPYKLFFKDGLSLHVSDFEVYSVDPQIPPVVAPGDMDATLIGKISGSSTHMDEQLVSIDGNAFIEPVVDIDVRDEDSNILPVIDASAVSVTGITMSDDNDLDDIGVLDLGNAVAPHTVDISVTDESITLQTDDVDSLVVEHVTGTVTDTAESAVVDTSAIADVEVGITITDADVEPLTHVDGDSIQLNNPHVEVRDVPDVVIATDVDAVNVDNITLASTDGNVATGVIEDSTDGATIHRPEITVNDEVTRSGITDVSAVTSGDITLSSVDDSTSSYVLDNSAATILNDRIAIDIIDNVEPITSSDSVSTLIDVTNIDAKVTDVEIQSSSTDNSSISPADSNLQVSISDEQVDVDTVIDSDGATVDTTSIKVEVVPIVNAASTSDVDSIIAYSDISVSMSDDLVENSEVDNSAISTAGVDIASDDDIEPIVMTDTISIGVHNSTISCDDEEVIVPPQSDSPSDAVSAVNIDISIKDE